MNNIPVETLENTKAALALTHADWVAEMKRANDLEATAETLATALEGLCGKVGAADEEAAHEAGFAALAAWRASHPQPSEGP